MHRICISAISTLNLDYFWVKALEKPNSRKLLLLGDFTALTQKYSRFMVDISETLTWHVPVITNNLCLLVAYVIIKIQLYFPVNRVLRPLDYLNKYWIYHFFLRNICALLHTKKMGHDKLFPYVFIWLHSLYHSDANFSSLVITLYIHT